MTIGGWILFGFVVIILAVIVAAVGWKIDSMAGWIISIIAGFLLSVATLVGLRWYYQSTASGQRALVDQKSELHNGIERTITVYTADGSIIAEYKGKIDIEGGEGGYVLFDYDGKRYMYYNCFVESIAEIDDGR